MQKILAFLLLLAMVLTLAACGNVSTRFDTEPGEAVDLKEIQPHIPENCYIELVVTRDSVFGTSQETYILSQKDGWIYLRFGTDREQYVYKPIGENQYIEYKYDTQKGTYRATHISDALQEQIDKGNVPLESAATSRANVDAKIRTIGNLLFAYENHTAILDHLGNMQLNDMTCCVYSGTVKVPGTTSQLTFAIDPNTGIVMRSENKTKALLISTLQITDCVVFELEGRIPEIP